MNLSEMLEPENEIDLKDIPSQKLQDFIGWGILADEDIDVDREEISYYQKIIDNKIASLLVIKHCHFYSEVSLNNPELVGEKMIELIAISRIRKL